MMASSALCRKMRLHAMSHMDGETSVLEKRRFDTHLQKCEACRTLVEELSGMLEAVRAERFIPTPKGRDEMLADVLGRIEQASPNQAMRLEIPRQRRYRFRILLAESLEVAHQLVCTGEFYQPHQDVGFVAPLHNHHPIGAQIIT